MTHWNWGTILGYIGVAQCVCAAIGYGFAGDRRRCLYYVFAGAITLTVVWPGTKL